jgi:hypothetical protein
MANDWNTTKKDRPVTGSLEKVTGKVTLSPEEMRTEEARWRALGRPLVGQVGPPRVQVAAGQRAARVPERWTPVHVLDRLEEAFEILSRLPMTTRPKGYQNSMPTYAYDASDLVGQVETGELERLARMRNRYRLRGATSAEIARMEQALGWAAEFLSDAPEVASAVQLAALWAALKVDQQRRCRERGINRRWFIRRQIHGINVIATALARRRAPIA